MSKWNWKVIREIGIQDGPFKNVAEFAKFVGVPRRTMVEAIERKDIPRGIIQQEGSPSEMVMSATTVDILSLDEVLEMFGVDTDI